MIKLFKNVVMLTFMFVLVGTLGFGAQSSNAGGNQTQYKEAPALNDDINYTQGIVGDEVTPKRDQSIENYISSYLSNESDISNNRTFSNNQSLRARDNQTFDYLVHVLWEDDSQGNNQIYYRRTGGLFDPTQRTDLSANSGDSRTPAIALMRPQQASNVYVAWSDNTGLSAGNYDILFKMSNDGGATFSRPVRISDNSGDSRDPSIAVIRKNVYIVWRDNTGGNDEILFSMSTNEGAAFSSPINLSNNLGASWTPKIIAWASNVHVFWTDSSLGTSEIFYRKSVDSGGTFGSIKNVSNAPGSKIELDAALWTSELYVVWTAIIGGKSTIQFTSSPDAGDTFSNVRNITSNGVRDPDIAVWWPNVYIVHTWSSGWGSYIELLLSHNNGASWGSHRLSGHIPFDFSNWNGSPAIAANRDNVYVAWAFEKDSFTPAEVYFKRSTTNGDTFEYFSTNLSVTGGSSDAPVLEVDPIYSVPYPP